MGLHMADVGGNVGPSERERWVRIVACISVIVISTTVLTFVDIPRLWTAIPTLASVLSATWLGKYLQDDRSVAVVNNQARPAVRHLFDQVDRLRALVMRADRYSADLNNQNPPDPRAADWFDNLSGALRGEIEATTSAIENWGDLASGVQLEELKKYGERHKRIPDARTGTPSASASDRQAQTERITHATKPSSTEQRWATSDASKFVIRQEAQKPKGASEMRLDSGDQEKK